MAFFKVREAILSDCDDVVQLIKESGAGETTKLTGQDLARDAFLSDPPLVQILVAEDTQLKGKLIGYTLWFYTYNMWKGKAIHIDDLYVKESPLNNSNNCHIVEDAMLAYLARIAKQAKISKISFESNPKVDLHKQRWATKYGAEDVTLSEQWHSYHFDLEKLVQNL